MPYHYRIVILVALLAVVAALDLALNRSRATRWREYALLLAGGLAGAAFGALNDVFITSAISPEYFVIGKGLPPDERLPAEVLWLGVQAGFGPGALAMGVYLYVNTRRPDRRPLLPHARLVRFAWMPLAGAVAFGAAFPLLFSSRDPIGFAGALSESLNPRQIWRFLVVWWTHLGIYTGFTAGLIAGATAIHRRRARHTPAP